MAPNTPTDFAILDPTFDVRANFSKFSSLSQHYSETEHVAFTPNVTYLQPDSEDKIHITYEEIHSAVNKTLRPFSNHYKPDVIIAINGGGSFLSMLLGCNVPTLPVVVSTAPNFITNENNTLRIQQWFDESSNEGLRVNNSRVLLVADEEIADGMLDFVKEELCKRSMPSRVAAVLLHQSNASEMEVVSALDTSNAQVLFPWNSDLTQRKATVSESKVESEGYWDWPAEDPLSISQIEKHLVSDSKRRQKEKVSHSESDVDNYWDWQVKEPSPSDVLKEIMEYESIRPTFTIGHIEERLALRKEEDVYEHRSTKNIFLGDYSEYWTWSSECIDSSEKPLANILQEDQIQQLLSVEHTEQQLKQSSVNEECKTPDESPYWSWMSSNIYAQSQLEEYLERVDNDMSSPHEEEKTEVYKADVDLEKEIMAIKNTMNPEELLQWVLDSCQLGLIPSSDILKKLLLTKTETAEIYQPLVDDCKPSVLESYWDESPVTKDAEPESYWDERPSNTANDSYKHYWDERPAESKDNASYWDEKPAESKDNASYWDEIPAGTNDNASYWDETPDSKTEVKDKAIANDERASVAAYYLSMLNKDTSIAAQNEDDERASLAAFYRQSMSQVNVTVAPVQKAVPSELVDDTKNENAGYWDEDCSDHEMQEDDKESYWD